jgi:Right handed beta helix region
MGSKAIKHTLRIFAFIFFGLTAADNMCAATYYVDAQRGNDTNTGQSYSKAWKTLDQVNKSNFSPGDQVLFRAGEVWTGQLKPSSSGTVTLPIKIGRYGSGSLPKLDGRGTVEDVVLLRNVQGIEVRDLELVNHGESPGVRRGVHIVLDNFGTAVHIIIAGLYIHDVNGSNDSKDNGGIIFRTIGEHVPSRFDDLRIEGNIVWRVDRSGIAAQSYHAMRSRWFPSLHVVIRDNYVEDIGGDGIVPWATDGALIEHNIARYCNRRAGSFNAGIWPWSTDNSTFQLNEAAFTQNTRDGEGFDSDYNSRNTLFQYNYSHDNQGGFMLICTPVKRDQTNNFGNTGTIIRYNVSWNDHNRLINLSGADDVRVDDNVFYVTPSQDIQVLLVSKWDGWSNNALFQHNTFYEQGNPSYGHEMERSDAGIYKIASGWGPAQGIRFSGNRYIGSNAQAPEGVEETIDKAAPVPELRGGEPTFDPAAPIAFKSYMQKHRAWMLVMLRDALGTNIQLAQ